MDTRESDVLIIGTGFGAAAPALRLAQAGLRVTMLEKGPHIDPFKDFRQTSDPLYLLQYLHGISSERLALTYAEAMGGGSGFYEMVSLRAPSIAFDQVDENGRRLWPDGVNRGTLDPFYDVAEEMLHVRQIPVELVPKSGQVFAMMMKRLGYSCDRARYAERGCVGSGFCVTGCIYAAKQSLLLNYLPQAVTAGATIETGIEALRVARLLDGRYEVRCRQGSRLVVYHSRILILGGGTIGTAKLLLSSRAELPFLGPQVGRNIAFNGSVKAAGMLADDLPDGDMFSGRTHPGMISYEFLQSHGITVSAAKAMPLQLVAGVRLRRRGKRRGADWWGEANVDLMRQYRHRVMALYSMGLTPPAARLSLGQDGQPMLELEMSRTLRKYHERVEALLQSILVGNGCELLDVEFVDRGGAVRESLGFTSAHQVGSCRMADSKQHGVVNAAGEVFDYPGLYVTDGSAIPSSLAVNTSLTILANAERIAAGMISVLAGRPPLARVSTS